MKTAKLLTSVCLLAVITGCGGSDETASTSTADVTPPSVTIAASSATVEGGETVALTVAANDTVDGASTPVVTCTGGTVVGNLLVTGTVAVDTSIICTARATDKAGNAGQASATIAVKATIATLRLATAATLSQGEFGAINVQNLPLTESRYSGTIGGRAITVWRGSASALNYVVPTDLAAGSQRLEVQIGTRRYSYELTIAAAPVVADQRTFATAALTSAIQTLDAFVAREGATMSSAQRGVYQGYRDQLTAGLTGVAGLNATDLATLVTIIGRNGAAAAAAAGSRSPLAFNEAQCDADTKRFVVAKELATVRLLTGLALIVIPEATVTKLAGLAVFIQAISALTDAQAAVQSLVNSCVDESEFTITPEATGSVTLGNYVRPLAVQASAGFENRRTKRFRLRETTRLNPGVAATVTAAFKQLTDLIAQLPYTPEGLRIAVGDFAAEKIVDVPASQVSLTGISNANITGSLSGSGSVISLTFTYNGTPPTENVAFTFNLVANGRATPVSAELTVALPGAEDAAVTLVQGKAITSQVQVRGADTIEIVQAPTKGTAIIGIDGALRYTPSGQGFGTDQLMYRARNINGVSRTATVLFTINRQFEGTWNISTRSTTTSQSQPGLCPAETNNFQIQVAKISDVQYTTSYGGFPLTLTMGSKDDPAGLRGQTTVTYDDAPGQTTETLTAAIPNSSQLNATSFFQYTGPNGTSCSGNVTITGTK